MTRVADIQNRLSSAFAKDPNTNLARFITLISDELDELDVATEAVRPAHQLELATGIQLDRVVDLIGVVRLPGETDAEFRARAGVVRWLQSSSGTKAEIAAIIMYLTGCTADQFAIIENPNADGDGSGWGEQAWGTSRWGGSYMVGQFRIAFYGVTEGDLDVSLTILYDAINAARAGGIAFLSGETTFE